MAEQSWHEARLIPTSGISGADEQERRATSALLAVMGVVKEFGRALVGPLGAPAGRIETFIEVPFELEGRRVIPDGLVRVSRGSSVWTALVEVKTGRNALESTQIENYLDVARDQGFDHVLTISNEIPAVWGQHPTKVDRRKLKKVDLQHWSWTYILSVAVMQKEHKGVTDTEQAWILGELIRYLEHPKSGALELDDMGAGWVSVRQAVSAGTLRANDKELPEVVARFDALLRYGALRLGRQLGTDVTPLLSRKEQAEPNLRAQALAASLVETGRLFGTVRIPNTVGPLNVVADLRSSRVAAYVDIDAPKEGRAQTRVNWLLRQLKHAPESLRVEVFVHGGRGAGETELLAKVREDPRCVIADGKKDIRTFRVEMSRPMGLKRGRGANSFIDSLVDLVDDFYGEVVQHLKAWAAPPPRMRETPAPPPETRESLVSTALSSQDEAEAPATALPSVPRVDGAGADL